MLTRPARTARRPVPRLSRSATRRGAALLHLDPPARQEAEPSEVAAFYLEWLQRFLRRCQGMTRRDLDEALASSLRPSRKGPEAVRPLLQALEEEGLATWRRWLPSLDIPPGSAPSMVAPLQEVLRRAQLAVGGHVGAVAARMALFSTAREVILGRESWVRDLGLVKGLVE